jgi:hypothetical protein
MKSIGGLPRKEREAGATGVVAIPGWCGCWAVSELRVGGRVLEIGACGSSVREELVMTVEGVVVWGMAVGSWSGGLPGALVAVGDGCVVICVGACTGGGGSLMIERDSVDKVGCVAGGTDPCLLQLVLAAAGCGGC